jgi:ribosomal protein L24E
VHEFGEDCKGSETTGEGGETSGELGQEGDTCEGHDETSNKPFPSCDSGFKCEDSGLVTIPGAGKICVRDDGTSDVAQEGDTCEGHDETANKPFPPCAEGLKCEDSGLVTIPGAGKICVREDGGTGDGGEGGEAGTLSIDRVKNAAACAELD